MLLKILLISKSIFHLLSASGKRVMLNEGIIKMLSSLEKAFLLKIFFLNTCIIFRLFLMHIQTLVLSDGLTMSFVLIGYFTKL